MKSILVPVVGLLVAAVVVSGCGSKYADVKKENAKFAKATEAYIAELEKADDAKSIAKAINGYADEMEGFLPKMKALSEKYPELEGGKELPKELEAALEESEAVGEKMASTFMKIMPHMTDPDVRKAQERLGTIMSQQ
ncbi:MAG: hypothetical protein HN919_22065 [Verrucomicrobia bacterium]|jgi:hypothetical protein|nr:hypothetical protein [Verrucomicrobiota bacterium]MBT7068999.1 hypothetical protein [Verrucomicrobiota bacterium]MBT7699188.1 hypothetical protein [Verrucomicrobiota bacterium]